MQIIINAMRLYLAPVRSKWFWLIVIVAVILMATADGCSNSDIIQDGLTEKELIEDLENH